MWRVLHTIRTKAGQFPNIAVTTRKQITKTYLTCSIDFRCKPAAQAISLNGRNTYSTGLDYISNSVRPAVSKNVTKKYKEMEQNLKWRVDPVIKTLDTPQFKSILRKNVLDLVAAFEKHNYEIRIAGGAVR